MQLCTYVNITRQYDCNSDAKTCIDCSDTGVRQECVLCVRLLADKNCDFHAVRRKRVLHCPGIRGKICICDLNSVMMHTDSLIPMTIDSIILRVQVQADNVAEKQRASAFGILSGIASCAFVCGKLLTRFISTSSTFQVS